jgi:hypothetical protein
MDKKLFILFFALIILSSSVYALSKADIVYPVSGLGNCANEQECQTFCDNNENIKVCLEFGEKYGLMTSAEVEEAKKVMEYILSGETPGGCKTKQACDNYCDQDQNLIECINFAVKAGFISQEEADMAKKTGGKGPGGCKREECETYCDDESHISECVDFAVQMGMMSQEEADRVKKTGGKGPGGCKSKEECDTYCNDFEHREECLTFAYENGFMTQEEYEQNKEQMNQGGEDGRCIMECMQKAGLDPRNCKPGENSPAECKPCEEKCVQFYNGPCLSEAQFKEKEAACNAQGEKIGIKPIMGDSGQEGRGECAVDVECFDFSAGQNPQGEGPNQSSNSENNPSGNEQPGECMDCVSKCENRPGQVLTGTNCVNNQCQCFYENEEPTNPEPGVGEGGSAGIPPGTEPGADIPAGGSEGGGSSGSDSGGGDSASSLRQ